MEKIEKNLVAKFAEEKLRSGKSKQEVYDELVEQYKYRNEVADVVVNIPTESRWKKYKVWNHLFLAFLILIAVFLLLKHPNFGLIWLSWLIYVVATRKFKFYYWNTLFGVISMLSVIAISIYDGHFNLPVVLSGILFSFTCIFAGIYLPRMMTPPFEEVRKPYTNTDGENRIMVKHIFRE